MQRQSVDDRCVGNDQYAGDFVLEVVFIGALATRRWRESLFWDVAFFLKRIRETVTMKTLIKSGRFVTAVDDYKADIFIDGETLTTIGKSLDMEADVVIDAAASSSFLAGSIRISRDGSKILLWGGLQFMIFTGNSGQRLV